MADAFMKRGYNIISSDNHMMLIDLRNKGFLEKKLKTLVKQKSLLIKVL
jgi:glycine/serine hydroxymethyltransferase